ncbi:MAG: hypothetical protein IT305_09200 [Chloroflexi bacterium]|nr:hypothetical protein [Chloroflexota bacterium]
MNLKITSLIDRLKGVSPKRTLATAAVGATAVLIGVAGPAEIAQAALRTGTVDGTTVTYTSLDTHNWSKLSPSNGDTVKLKDGSRGEVWAFDAHPGQCFTATMTSDDFHPFLVLRKNGPFGPELAHDDSRTDNWAKIRGTAGNEGTYFVMATSSGEGEKIGNYTLDIEGC